MADAMTEVHAGGFALRGEGAGMGLWGRVPADQAVTELREHITYELKRYQKALAALDAGEVYVSWRRGHKALPDPDGRCYPTSGRYTGAVHCVVHGHVAGWPCGVTGHGAEGADDA